METAGIITLNLTGAIAVLTVVVGVVAWDVKLAEKVNTIKEWIDKNDSLGIRLAVLEEREKYRNERYTHKNSPVSLTDEGAILLKESGAGDYIEKNKEGLLRQFENITAPYDIQERAGELMTEKLRNNDTVKDFAFVKVKGWETLLMLLVLNCGILYCGIKV